ncbi:MAG: hypothetical protein GY856_55600 [bacterium]|nr:hypothetical protein [bacterium]
MKRMVGLVVLLLVAAVPATASTFVAMSFGELVDDADAIVVGRITSQEASWTESGRMIVTDNQLRVEEIWAGEAPDQLSVRTFGGQVGDFLVEAHGFPQFKAGEHVILFLTHEPESDTLQVLGYQLGHFRVVTRLDGVTLAVPQVDDGMRLIDRSGDVAPKSRSLRFDELKATVLERVRSRTGIEFK